MNSRWEHLKDLEHERPSPQEIADWAARVCRASRKAHIDLWMSWSSDPQAEGLHQLLARLASRIPRTGECGAYRENLLIRAKSVENFRLGRPPELPDGAVPEELSLSSLCTEEAREALERFENSCGRLQQKASQRALQPA